MTVITAWFSGLTDRTVVMGPQPGGEGLRGGELLVPAAPDRPRPELRAAYGVRNLRVRQYVPLRPVIALGFSRVELYEPHSFDCPVPAGWPARCFSLAVATTTRFADREHLCDSGLPRLDPVVVLVQPPESRFSARRARAVDPVDRCRVFPRRGRLQHPDDPADDADGRHRRAVFVDGHHGTARRSTTSCCSCCRPECSASSCRSTSCCSSVLGSDAGADVFPDRNLGRRPAALFGDQVLPLHPGRQRRPFRLH